MAEPAEDPYTIIDAYLTGTLTETEALTFQQRMKDPLFAKEVAFRQDLLLAAKSIGREQLKTELQSIEANRAETPVRSLRTRPKWLLYGLAAAAVVLLLFSIWLGQPTEINQQQLFAEHFSPFPNVEQVITRDQVITEDVLTQAYASYELARYDQAIGYFAQLLETEPKNLSHQFYQALSQLALARPVQAQSALERVSQSDTSRYARPAVWFLALTHLQNGEFVQTRSLLKEILQQTDHPYYREAETLLQQIGE